MPRTSALAIAIVLGLVSSSACGVARRASVNAVDTQLRARGEHLVRDDDRDGLTLGAFELTSMQVEQTQVDPAGPLAKDDLARPIVQHHLAMRLRGPSGAEWRVECISQRRQSTSADYAAMVDENRDDVAVHCDLREGADTVWRFVTEAGVAHNFRGQLTPSVAEALPLSIEVLVYVQRWGWLRRHLPDPVAQVRRDDKAVAAMLLGRPEEAWISADLPPALAEPSVAAMLALHHLPLGLDE